MNWVKISPHFSSGYGTWAEVLAMGAILTDVATGYRYRRVSGYDAKTPEEEVPEADEASEEELEELEDEEEDDKGA